MAVSLQIALIQVVTSTKGRRANSEQKQWEYHSAIKKNACNAGDLDSIPGSGRSPGEENGNPLQYSCLENPMHRGAWQATVHGGHKRVGHDLATEHAHTVQTKYTYS